MFCDSFTKIEHKLNVEIKWYLKNIEGWTDLSFAQHGVIFILRLLLVSFIILDSKSCSLIPLQKLSTNSMSKSNDTSKTFSFIYYRGLNWSELYSRWRNLDFRASFCFLHHYRLSKLFGTSFPKMKLQINFDFKWYFKRCISPLLSRAELIWVVLNMA